MKKPTNGKCKNFINANCSFNCPNASLDYACDRYDLDPSDFGMERISCKNCYLNDDNCTCDDCFVQFKKEYCSKKKENIK